MQQYLDDWARIRCQFLSLHCFFLSRLPLINPLLSRLQDCYPTAWKKECKGWITHSQIQVIPGGMWMKGLWMIMKGNTVGFLRQWEDKGTFWSLILPRTSFRCFQKHNTAVSTFTLIIQSVWKKLSQGQILSKHTQMRVKYSPIQSRTSLFILKIHSHTIC